MKRNDTGFLLFMGDYSCDTYASFGPELLRVSGRVGVSRSTSAPQLSDDQSVSDAENGQWK